MPTKRAKPSRLEILATAGRSAAAPANQQAFGVIPANAKLRNAMHVKNPASANEYRCAIERNQNGKYNVRVRAVFGPGGRDSENGRCRPERPHRMDAARVFPRVLIQCGDEEA